MNALEVVVLVVGWLALGLLVAWLFGRMARLRNRGGPWERK